MSKYEAVYFVGDNQAINRVRVDSPKTRNRGAFSGSLAALIVLAVYLALYQLLSVPERARICFRLSFLAAAATLWSLLNISLIISRRALAREGDYEMMPVRACVRACVCACVS